MILSEFSVISLFYGLGLASSKWYLIHGLQVYTLWRNLLGAVANIGLNIILIPSFGLHGAVYGTLISFIIANYLFDAINKKTRPLFLLKTRSLFFLDTRKDTIFMKRQLKVIFNGK
mgnify:CR=1 FL=1